MIFVDSVPRDQAAMPEILMNHDVLVEAEKRVLKWLQGDKKEMYDAPDMKPSKLFGMTVHLDPALQGDTFYVYHKDAVIMGRDGVAHFAKDSVAKIKTPEEIEKRDFWRALIGKVVKARYSPPPNYHAYQSVLGKPSKVTEYVGMDIIVEVLTDKAGAMMIRPYFPPKSYSFTFRYLELIKEMTKRDIRVEEIMRKPRKLIDLD